MMQKHRFNIFPRMQTDDYQRLLSDLSINGYDSKNPIWTYGGDVLDGWNRYLACNELNIVPVIREFTGSDTDALMFVMRTNKRRNLTSSQWAAIAADAEDILASIREAVEADRRRKIAEQQTISNSKSVSKDDVQTKQLIVGSEKKSTNETDTQLAGLFNTNRTYISDARKLRKTKPEVFEQVKAGTVMLSSVKKEEKTVHVSNNSGENEWYTPENIIELARTVMGSIDTDPASSEFANKTVKAKVFFTKENDGLLKEWFGNVWMNPPYAQPLITKFCDKLLKELSGHATQAIVLVNNATDTAWFHSLAAVSTAICFTKGRVRFIDQYGTPSGAPLQGQAILYFGEDIDSFITRFTPIGFILINPSW